jgi:pyruvate dehydrogenase E2 component (dihydrolipoamide acetyltransferase)
MEEQMATVVEMPKLGMSMTEGTIEKWLKQEGEKVEKGEPLVCILTEKISYEYESPASGVLRKILGAVNELIPITEPIAIIAGAEEDISGLALPQSAAAGTKEERPAEVKAEPAPREGKRVHASPLAKKIAQEKGIDLAKVAGTGPGGRITQEDVEKFAETGKKTPASPAAPIAPSETPGASTETVPISGIRRTIGQRMSESKKNIPHFYLSVEVNVSRLMDLRKELLGYIEKEKGVRVSLTDLLVKVVAHALEDHPLVNSTLEGQQIRLYKEINVGVAMAGKDGLIVPVIRRANQCSIGDISSRAKELNQKLQEGALSLDDVSGGTFTLSNLGMYGIDLFTAIINPPQSAILAVGKVSDKPVAVDGQVVVRPMMWMTLSVDHRILDGKQAAEFLGEIKRLVENPQLLLT